MDDRVRAKCNNRANAHRMCMHCADTLHMVCVFRAHKLGHTFDDTARNVYCGNNELFHSIIYYYACLSLCVSRVGVISTVAAA